MQASQGAGRCRSVCLSDAHRQNGITVYREWRSSAARSRLAWGVRDPCRPAPRPLADESGNYRCHARAFLWRVTASVTQCADTRGFRGRAVVEREPVPNKNTNQERKGATWGSRADGGVRPTTTQRDGRRLLLDSGHNVLASWQLQHRAVSRIHHLAVDFYSGRFGAECG